MGDAADLQVVRIRIIRTARHNTPAPDTPSPKASAARFCVISFSNTCSITANRLVSLLLEKVLQSLNYYGGGKFTLQRILIHHTVQKVRMSS